MDVKKVFERYLEVKALSGLSLRSCDTYKSVGKSLYLFLKDKQVGDITMEDMIAYRYHLMNTGVCDNTIAEYLLVIKATLTWCDDNLTACPISKKIPYVKYHRRLRPYLNNKQVSKMIDCTSSVRDKAIISLLYSSGIRRSEIISLNKLDIKKNYFSVCGKGGKNRLCFVDNRTRKLLDEYLATRTDNLNALFVSNQDNRITKATLDVIIKKSAKLAGISFNVSPHTFRHSFATNFISNNGNVRVLADMLGHSSVNTTMIYTHNTNPDLLRAYRKYHTC